MSLSKLHRKTVYLLIASIFVVSSSNYCQPEEKEEVMEGEIVAKVGANVLYQEEIENLLPPQYDSDDSINIVKRYVNNWVERELLLKEAEKGSGIDQKELQDRIEDYKFQLLVHAYKQKYINDNLDTVVTEAQLSKYYEENEANFELKQPIVRAYFVKVKNNIPETKLEELKKWIRSSNTEELDQLKSYSYGFAERYFLEDDKWLSTSELAANTPFDRNQLLRNNLFLEERDSLFQYLLKVNEVRIQEQIAPLEYVKPQIESIILNKRKVALQEELENSVMERAVENKDYQIFNK